MSQVAAEATGITQPLVIIVSCAMNPLHLDPTLLTGLGLVLGTALKTLIDYVVKQLRPHDDPQHARLCQELLAEAEAL
jgi:hypothetical protein